MVAAVRALADRFIYDSATLKYVALSLPEGAAERVTAGSGWTVRQVLAHLALNQQRYARVTSEWMAGSANVDLGGDPTHRNEETARETATMPADEIAAAFDEGLTSLVSCAQEVGDDRATASFGGYPFVDVLARWSRHAAMHAVDLVAALPEFKTDPMVLNWVLHFDYGGQSEWREWQLNLIDEVREMFQLQGEEA